MFRILVLFMICVAAHACSGDNAADGDTDFDTQTEYDGEQDSGTVSDHGTGSDTDSSTSTPDLLPDEELWVNNETGDDSNNGSENSPFQTIDAALGHLNGLTHIHVQATNTSYEGVCVWDSDVALIGEGGKPLIDQIVECDGRNSLLFSRGDDVRFENFELDASAFAGQHVRALIFSGLPDAPIYRNVGRNIDATGPGFGQAGRSLISSSLCYDCILEDSSSINAEEHGIYWTNHQDGSIIRNNYVEAADGACLQLNSDPETFDAGSPTQDGHMSNGLVENNILYNCGSEAGSALNLAGVTNTIFRNNIIYGTELTGGIANWDDGFGEQFGCADNQFFNNTIDCRHCTRHAVSFRNGSTGNEFKNNIVLTSERDAVAVDAESNANLDVDYNLYVTDVFFEDVSEDWIEMTQWQAQGYDSNSVVTSFNSLFEQADNGDYHLAGGSPAIDTGTTVDAPQDKEGNSRPTGSAFDMGAFEYQ